MAGLVIAESFVLRNPQKPILLAFFHNLANRNWLLLRVV